MIDIHSHILPMVDDGASSVEMALEMLSVAYQDGVDALFLTPHFAYPYGFINPKRKIMELFEELKYIVKKEHIPIDLYLGCEYLYTSKEDFLNQLKDITTLNSTKYILMEFFFDEQEETMIEAVQTVRNSGYIPILAHIERFDCVQNSPSLGKELLKNGALLQLNKGSVLGRYGRVVKETAEYFLSHHYYSFVGSDAHHPKLRSSLMYDAYDYVAYHYGKSYADEIFYENARKLLKES